MNTDKQKISILEIGKWYTYNGDPSSSTSSHKAGIDIMVVSQNQINNTSLVRVRPWGIKLSGSTFNLSQQTLTVKVNNSSKTSKTTYDFREASTDDKFYLTSGYPFKRHSGSGSLVSGAYVYDFTITHDDDGSKSIPVYALIPFYNSASGRNWTVDIDIDLPKIPRANTATYSYTTLGKPITISINKSSASFTTTVSIMFSKEGTSDKFADENIAEKTTETELVYNMSETFKNALLGFNKTVQKVTAYLTLYTYSEDTLLATKQYSFVLPLENTPPVISATYEDTNASTIALTGNSSKIIKYVSQPKVTITATPQQMADIVSYSTIWGNSSSTTQKTTFVNGIDSNILQVSAKDSRKWVGNISYDINENYIEYIKLGFEKFTLERPETTSNTINANLNGVWFNGNFGVSTNTIELKFRYKEKNGEYGEYQSVSLTTKGNTFSFNGSLGDVYNYQKQYDFEFVLTDKVMSLITTFNVTSGESIIRVAETYVRILGDVRVRGNLTLNDELVNKQIGDIVITSTNENPSSRLGETWELIDKEFINFATNSNDNTYFTPSSSVTFDAIYIMRTNHNLKLRLGFTTEVNLGDTSVQIGTINYNNLGIDNISFGLYGLLGYSDGGNGILLMAVHYSTGELTSVDVVPKGTATTIPSGSYCYVLIDILLTKDFMLDEACDKFYWKKVS